MEEAMHPRFLLAACDSRSATLFEITREGGGRLHAEVIDSIHSRWEDFHEHGRPSRLGQGPSANASQHFADEHREPLEFERREARDLVSWIARHAATEANVAVFHVFADPRMLGAMRAEIGLRGRSLPVELERGELNGLRPHQIAEHPRVRTLAHGVLAVHQSQR
jgi:protein required for attachment to host cells